MTKNFALGWLWFVLSIFFTIVILPVHSIHTWWIDSIVFFFVAVTIHAIYTLITEKE